MSFVSSKGNILCRLIKIELYKIFAIINRAIKGLHCINTPCHWVIFHTHPYYVKKQSDIAPLFLRWVFSSDSLMFCPPNFVLQIWFCCYYCNVMSCWRHWKLSVTNVSLYYLNVSLEIFTLSRNVLTTWNNNTAAKIQGLYTLWLGDYRGHPPKLNLNLTLISIVKSVLNFAQSTTVSHLIANLDIMACLLKPKLIHCE